MNTLLRYKVFAAAIAISAAWHIFWISAIGVAAPSANMAQVKFSKVSFLGPLLEAGPVEVRIAPPQRSILEKRYLVSMEKAVSCVPAPQAGSSGPAETPRADIYTLKDWKTLDLIKDSVDGPKIEHDI